MEEEDGTAAEAGTTEERRTEGRRGSKRACTGKALGDGGRKRYGLCSGAVGGGNGASSNAVRIVCTAVREARREEKRRESPRESERARIGEEGQRRERPRGAVLRVSVSKVQQR